MIVLREYPGIHSYMDIYRTYRPIYYNNIIIIGVYLRIDIPICSINRFVYVINRTNSGQLKVY